LLNSVNPFRLEGQKTIVLELLQQLGWESPDWIVVPAGNLGNTAAFGKALEEARAWGLIDHAPRLAAVQAQGAAPFAQSFREGFVQRHRLRPPVSSRRGTPRPRRRRTHPDNECTRGGADGRAAPRAPDSSGTRRTADPIRPAARRPRRGAARRTTAWVAARRPERGSGGP